MFNVDETSVTTEHSPPQIVCNKETKPQAITSGRSSTVTIIAGRNAIGNSLPPYFVFSGKRWNPKFLKGEEMSDKGNNKITELRLSNTTIFNNYVTKHFAKYGNISKSDSTLLLYDWHRSHINLTLTDWAKKHNVVLFVLPPHTIHLTQPLDVWAFGPLKSMYSKECQMYL